MGEWVNAVVDKNNDFRKPWMKWAGTLSCTIGSEATTTTYYNYRRFFDQLNGFKNLTSLRLASVRLDSRITIPKVNVKVLTLENCDVEFDAFAPLVENLPKLTHLILIEVCTFGCNPPPCGFSQSLRKLSFLKPCHWSVDLIKMFIPAPQWDEVSISWGNVESTIYQAFIQCVGANVIGLDLQGNPGSTYSDASYMGILKKKSTIVFKSFDLRSCTKLRELKIGNCSYGWDIYIIGTITSTEIRKIILTESRILGLPRYEHNLERGLCALVDRTGAQLEVEFRGDYFLQGDRGVVFEDYLPYFLQCKGAKVKFVDVEGNIIYSWGAQPSHS